MLNIYLAQLFSNSDCGNEKGCLGGELVSRQLRVCGEKTKTSLQVFGFLLFIFDIRLGVTTSAVKLRYFVGRYLI